MSKIKYILLEGLPGCGKSSFIFLLQSFKLSFSVLPDFGNPKFLESDFFIDYNWVIDIECQKSQLSLRSRRPLVIQERGFLSILAFHAAMDKLTNEKTYTVIEDRLKIAVASSRLIIPDLIIIPLIEPAQSMKNQPGVILKMWKDISILEEIQNYYIWYSRKPLFHEKVLVVHWIKFHDIGINLLS